MFHALLFDLALISGTPEVENPKCVTMFQTGLVGKEQLWLEGV